MMRTRSATKRIESGQVPCGNGEQTQELVDLLTRDGGPSRAKKRQRDGTTSPKKRRRKEPGKLCRLNLDVLFLIAAYLHPMDLLNLARTCKSLGELLMDNSAEFIWKYARQQVPHLPACPADLTEPEYANFMFSNRCHSCGKHANMIFWKMRRRYCLRHAKERLRPLSSCNEIIRPGIVLANEYSSIKGATEPMVDKEQVDSFVYEYTHSLDKQQFLSEKERQYSAIRKHAAKCEAWRNDRESERKAALESRRMERECSIFARLREHGYERELNYFGYFEIRRSRQFIFKKTSPLTDREWSRIWPEWVVIMDNFRSRRLERIVYPRRENDLKTQYASYVACPPSKALIFNILPHVTDVARLPPFRDVIMAPEETLLNAESMFESAFAQLPSFVNEWRKELELQLANLVEIPPNLSFRKTSKSHGAKRVESSRAATDKLRLASAVFDTGSASMYPEVLSSMFPLSSCSKHDLPIEDRFNIKFLKDAPHIIHACGLDPNIATAKDMDRRNAWLKCLCCRSDLIFGWRDAMQHAARWHGEWRLTHDMALHWQVISDKYMDAIQSAELSMNYNPHSPDAKCLFCHPSVGDARDQGEINQHLGSCHRIKNGDIQEGVHYMKLKLFHTGRVVQMVEKGRKVEFKMPHIQDGEVFRFSQRGL